MTESGLGDGGLDNGGLGDGGLGDVRVIEMGQLLAGPFCGQLLGDFGAEVIKVEAPGTGDPMREWGREKPHGQSLWWPILARNKKSVTLNLRVQRGQELARSLIATADVLVENFRPGTLERWGLAPADLWRANPGLIITRVTGYGQSGPYAARAGFGSIGEAMGGIRYVTGDPDKPPSRAGISLGDELAGTFAALGTLVALHARQRTGRGQIVDAALHEAVLALMESLLPEWAVAGYQRERTGSVLPNGLGELANRMSANGKARELHREALAKAIELGAPGEEARALAGLGRSQLGDGPAEAARNLRDALAIYQRIGAPDAQAVQDTLDEHGL